MVVDTSAAMAILIGEPDGPSLAGALDHALLASMSSATAVELGIVLEGRIGPAAPEKIERFIRDARIEVVPVETVHVARAMEGWRRFGKGRHRAALNFGDCFTYALASATGRPVLCTGNDFALTDVDVVNLADGPPAGG